MQIKDDKEFYSTMKDIITFMPPSLIGVLWNLIEETSKSEEDQRALYDRKFSKIKIKERYEAWKEAIINYRDIHKIQKNKKRFPIYRRNLDLYAKSSLH